MSTPSMATFILSLGGICVLLCGARGVVNGIDEKGDQKEKRELRIEHIGDSGGEGQPDKVTSDTEVRLKLSRVIENSPELVLNVSGIEQPLCFNVGTREETVRVLQDPKTGIIVNAQILHDNLNNKTYIGTILISHGNTCLLGTQYFLLVNDAKYSWTEETYVNVNGHTVSIKENTVKWTFRHCRITLVVHRHATGENSMDYSQPGREGPQNKPDESNVSQDGDKEVTGSEGRPDMRPAIQQSQSFTNRLLSPKRRRELLMQQYFGINEDSAVVRNIFIQLDSQARKKRDNGKGDSGDNMLPAGATAEQAVEGSENQPQQDNMEENQSRNNQRGDELKNYTGLDNDDEGKQDASDDDNGSRTEREAEKRRDSTIVLDIYINDSRDLSNRTHGLLGQFLFKNVTREKIRYKDGKATARLLLQENPVRRTNALFTSRYYDAINGTRKCWKIRQNGREILDGNYSDYTVSSIYNRSFKELPPPAPL